MQINRLFEIVYLLMNKKTTTARELSEHFEVSQRTIYRDIDILCQSGIPIYTTKGKGGGICLMENFVLNKSVLSGQEQNDILSALHGFKATSFIETDQVLSKLNSLFGSKNMDWIEVDFTNWSSSSEDKTKFNELKNAILNRHIIEFHYYNSYGQQSYRIIEPQKLIFRGMSWYLYGYHKEKDTLRYYKISRIQNLLITDKACTSHPVLTTSEKDTSSAPPIQNMTSYTLKVDADLAYRVYDEFQKEEIEKQEDGSFIIRSKIMDGGWFPGYLMSFGDNVEVLEPESLRKAVIETYQNALKKYII
ncbi:MAG: YafY family protein [Mobilitalea sp.]